MRFPTSMALILILACLMPARPVVAESVQADDLPSQQLLALYLQGQFAEGIRLGEDLLARSAAGFEAFPLEKAAVFNGLGMLYRAAGLHDQAEDSYQQALSIRETDLGREHPDTASILNNQAELYRSVGKLDKAEPLYRQALAVYVNSLGSEHLLAANIRNNLAALYKSKGDYRQAESLFKSALKTYEKILGAKHIDTARVLNNLAELYCAMADFAQAEPLFERALSIYRQSGDGEQAGSAAVLNNLAGMYSAMGDYSRAESLYKHSLAIHERIFGEQHRLTANSLNNLAAMYQSMGDFIKAEPLLLRALSIYPRSLGDFHPEIAKTLNNLAELYRAVGDYPQAESLFKRSLAMYEQILGEGHIDMATPLNNLAELYWLMGDFSKAEPFYLRNLGICENVLGAEHPQTVQALHNLAMAQAANGRDSLAFQLFQRGLAAQRRIIENVFTVAGEAQKLRFIQQSAWGYHGFLSLIQRKFAGDQLALRAGLDAVLSRKGIVFDSQARQSEAMAGFADADAIRIWTRLSEDRVELANLLQAGEGRLSAAAYRAKLESLNSGIETHEANLAAKNALIGAVFPRQGLSAEQLAASLPGGAMLAEFVRISDVDWRTGRFLPSQRYLAFLLHPDQHVDLVDLGDADRIDGSIRRFLAELGQSQSIYAEAKAGSELYRQVWAPIKPYVADSGRVFVSPDGVLNMLPFAAINQPGGKYLVEDFEFIYLNSGRDLAAGSQFSPGLDLFLAANPEFDPQKAAAAPLRSVSPGKADGLRFHPLPGTAVEAATLPDLLPGDNRVVLTATDATEAAVLAVKHPKVLHLATHGFFLPDLPAEKSLGQGQGLRTERMPEANNAYENPLVRSGLAFAGANVAEQKDGKDDGLLTALEVAGMDLHGTDLVTLSACDTALGEVKAGEGVFGLRRAFALAGARHLMMSLWPVSDQITAQQMISFYKLYGNGASPAKALRAAQLQTIAELRRQTGGQAQASLWGAFIVQSAGIS